MDQWLDNLFREIIWQALRDMWEDIATWGETQIETKLKELASEVGSEKPLASSPLVRVTNYTATSDPEIDHITFLIRGRIPLFKGMESVFMRVEVIISTDVDLMSGGSPITIIEWITVMGDLKIRKKKVFNAQLGLGYDDGVWMGHGALKIEPAGFGLDLFLGGLSDRGVMIGLDVDLPAPVPLGSTGLGLAGMGGDFAYNFIARLEKNGLPVTDPAANDYVRWAKNKELDRWQAGPIDQTAVGVGIRTDLVTLADNGYVLKLEPIGLAVLTPGPVFILGGTGKLISSDSAQVEGYIVVDIASASMALGMGVKVNIPKDGKTYLLRANGVLDAFFSFENPTTWYINLGTQQKQISGKILSDLLRAELFFMINNYRMAFGAGISIGGEWKWSIITLFARIGAAVAATIGWNPVLLEGLFKIWGELGLKVWKFKFALSGAAEVLGHTPDPTELDVTFKYKLNLPWPIPDIKGEKTLTLGDEEPEAPAVASPLLAGTWKRGAESDSGAMKPALLHALTGRQWEFNAEARGAWPDAEIVIPFSTRVIDQTGKVVGSAISAASEGGYTVTHRLDALTVTDIAQGTTVAGIQAVWAAGPGGDTARLHINGQDPFAWVVPHVDTIESTYETPGRTCEVNFGYGTEEHFINPRRFNEMLVDPIQNMGSLETVFQPALPTRVFKSERFELAFRTATDLPVEVEQITLYLVGNLEYDRKMRIETKYGVYTVSDVVWSPYDTLQLMALTIQLPQPEATIVISSGSKDRDLLLYAVRYTEARQRSCNWQEKVVLTPGRYEVSLSGTSVAEYPGGGLPSSKTTEWELNDTFNIDFPETLRPYIRSTTIGDNRIFFDESLPWNPTMYGFGFPIYQDYRPAVRFLVPYMDAIFNPLRMRIVWESGGTVVQDLIPGPNGDGDSYLPGQSRQWIAEHCGTVSPDQEIVLPDLLTQSGPAAVALAFEHPERGEVKLDGWNCYVSMFASFTEHLDWNSRCLTVRYGPGGRTESACCPSIIPVSSQKPHRPVRKGNRVDPIFARKTLSFAETFRPVFENDRRIGSGDLIQPVYPEELSVPPVNWRLPTAMTQWITPLDALSAERFTRFAAASGARFNDGSGDILDGINDTVERTTIEAVTDGSGRPLALWVRTPEPVDWRRVEASLQIRHVEQSGDCPTGYELRHPLELTVEILPSPDATSAFLVGGLAGHRTRLPRGEYTLTLRFDTTLPGLPRLRPSPAVGGPTEQIALTFIQPFGERWPLPASPIEIPAGLLERLAVIYEIPWDIIDALIDPRVDPDWIKERLRGDPTPPLQTPDQPALDAFSSAVKQLEKVSKRLADLPESLGSAIRTLSAAETKSVPKTSAPDVGLDSDVSDKGGME
ncbi:hypothetical protein ACXWTF_03520 [Thiomicrolovo sp. ZZH C-3]